MGPVLNKKTIFLSDVHLNEVDTERQQRLVAFLSSINGLERLYILGDLFDFWFGYKTVVFRYFFPVLCQLYRLYQNGCQIIYVLGNHDFNLGPLFEETIPLRIIESSAEESLYDFNIVVIHGDGLDKRDLGYRFLRFVVRSRPVRFAFQWVHPDIGWKLARLLSKGSKHYTGWKNIDRLKAYTDYGFLKVSQGADLCVMAHSHQPFINKYTFPEREAIVVNIGDWIDHSTFLQLTPEDGPRFFRYHPGSIQEISPECFTINEQGHISDNR